MATATRPGGGFAAPTTLFDLATFEHRALFDGVENAWEALGERLIAYMNGITTHRLEGTIEPGAFVQGPVLLAKGALIEAGAYVRGPAVLGPGTVVRHGAYLRGYVLAGRDCIIGHDTEAKGAVFFDKASAGHFAYVGDSILGNRVNLGAGTKLANFRVFPGTVKINLPDGESIDSRLEKLGALLGDDVAIGCNGVTAPGTIVGRGSRIYSLASVRGTIAPRMRVALRQQLDLRPLGDEP
jgi:UDP-N-acetylglucosamine diphosphorylase / glucose-1-phosphate thymidylyltransferase / UDP-N-acetylgalactosamine diphosphorylase / glucosamine-1-phosphate N-acetyltransferase / galactosamine-1-phosphate N-acetyltransferase